MTNTAVRARLEAERTRLLDLQTAAEALHAPAGSADEGSGGSDALPSEAATATLDRELDESVADHATAELAEIDAALERVTAGTYGTCETCAKPIPADRLEFLPATRYCVEDQEKAERDR